MMCCWPQFRATRSILLQILPQQESLLRESADPPGDTDRTAEPTCNNQTLEAASNGFATPTALQAIQS